ncbi:ferric reductase-like transmembrane domain-containing protein [Labrenzia sp. PHM005]|uniref:ferric reductase-like transmembrane domain-containing protein n=1 Tax=Labrenzia sp. PHM005 TaxID=2590016 RepID=UPI001FFD2475|nr:ferric reductase-like transmembrane domain-containing protein [Labrenzia sp. PHM005]
MSFSRSDQTGAGGSWLRSAVIWAVVLLVVIAPLVAAAMSPLLQWRQPVYILAGFAGVIALALLLFQPLLAGGYLPGFPSLRGRSLHRWVGAGLVFAVIVHVTGLWITSPPDVIDVLLFRSPTPFSLWGVAAMWAVFAAALVAALRKRLRIRPKVWRRVHTALALVIVVGSVVHALLIEGTMEPVSKAILCVLVLLATLKAVNDLKIWALLRRRQA